jgi:hypothetical protein
VSEEANPLNALGAEQVPRLAERVVELVQTKQNDNGPFRSLQDFLSGRAEWGGRSVLEKAIEDSGLNPSPLQPVAMVETEDYPGFSSLTITPADIMSALAPYLRVRSDTFAIRVYVECLYPASTDVAARSWAEAIVQRCPAPVDAGDSIDQPSGRYGRRFNLISFRWLHPADL